MQRYGAAMADDRDPALTAFVGYMDRSREYYAAQGYERPYRWAHHDDVPFARPTVAMAHARVGVVTTTALAARADDDAPGAAGGPFTAPSTPSPARMHTAHLEWDQETTHTEDLDSFLPLHRLTELADTGRIGSVSPRFYGVPTLYSHRQTQRHAETVTAWCRADEVDVVLLVPL